MTFVISNMLVRCLFKTCTIEQILMPSTKSKTSMPRFDKGSDSLAGFGTELGVKQPQNLCRRSEGKGQGDPFQFYYLRFPYPPDPGTYGFKESVQ